MKKVELKKQAAKVAKVGAKKARKKSVELKVLSDADLKMVAGSRFSSANVVDQI